ncbi:putative carboxylesterase 15 [Lasiodiplodia theobromae]|uniref:Putative carboxylesterase 15 n=1 Tax=Lasiodiplodia theobromae TaxID=45133 RepID=A0A5N5D5V8_9PEZI|nr:putative carboxylesterase 15 [Lasiodiplodia theobromae]
MNGTFESFDLLSATYKTVDNVLINVDVLAPKNLTAGLHPCIFRFHGGGFVSGSTLHPRFFPQWVLELSLIVGAIIVLPNYRLLPESNVPDMLADLDDFWIWTRNDLDSLLATASTTGLRADLSRILTVGESAGGYLSVQFAMNHVHEGVRACIAECAFLDATPVNTTAFQPHIGPPVIADPTLSRFNIIDTLIANGTFTDYFGNDPDVYPIKRLEAGAKMPPTFLIHGLDDTVVPDSHSIRFAETVRKVDPSAKVHLELQPGEHLMDIPLRLGHAWLIRGVRLILEEWL